MESAEALIYDYGTDSADHMQRNIGFYDQFIHDFVGVARIVDG